MSNIRQDITFEKGGLNWDDAQIYMPPGDSPYFLNIIKGEDGNNGVITNSKGNLKITYQEPLVLSHAYFVLGSFYNTLTRKNYFFIFSQPYDSGGGVYLYDNRLLCLNEDAKTIDTIFKDIHNDFELDPAHNLTDTRMINTWLFFNPVTAQPKMIDVVMAYNYTNFPAYDDTDPSNAFVVGDRVTYRGGLFVANTTITAGQTPATDTTVWDRIGDSYQDESTIGVTEFNRAFFAIKTPPVDRIKTAYGSDVTKNFNNVRGKIFRFCHRYQYFDDSYSVCSAYSDITLPIDDEVYNGEKAGSIGTNNYITLSFSLYSASLVKNIEIFSQEGINDWKRLTIINRQQQSLIDDIPYAYNFYNNETYPTVAQSLITKIQDAVPNHVSSQEIINKNVLCYAGCTEGFPNLDKDLIDVTLTPTIKELETIFGESIVRRDNVLSGDITQSSQFDDQSGMWLYSTVIDIGTWFAGAGVTTGDVYKIQVNGQTNYLILTGSDVTTAQSLASAMAGLYASATAQGDTVVFTDTFNYIEIQISKIFKSSSTITALIKQGGFKTGADHPFCLFYYDEALRRGNVQATPDMSIYIPLLNENSPPVVGTNYKWNIDWAVNHEPPSWARYWKWGYAGNRKCSKFIQYIVLDVVDGSALVANSVAVDITPLMTIKNTTETNWNCFPNSTIPQYDFAIGDRIRFITEQTVPAVTGTTLGDVIDGVYDFEILSFDDTSNYLYIQTFDFASAGIGVNTLVEIYTPTKDSDVLDTTKTLTYYEFGDLMPIITDSDGNLAHGGKTQNQELTVSPQPATGTFEYGDVYHILRTPSKPLCTFDPSQYVVGAFHETMAWSDFYDSSEWNQGKLGLESLIGEVYLNFVRFSNVYLQDTQINGLTTFEATNYKELNDTFGRIISIVEVGDTLKCYQEKKPSSIQIGRTEYYDTNGVSNNVQTQSFVLGSIRYAIPNYGVIFPESISKNNRYVYGFDIYNGLVWRDSANGIFPISGRYADIGASTDYKMMSYFKAKAKALLASGVENVHVLSVWDEEYKMLFLCFKDAVNQSNNETVVFHEPSDKWICFTEFNYTPYGGWNSILELSYSIVKGFENGIGYSWDEASRFAIFDIGDGVGTSPNTNIHPLSIPLVITIPTPVVTCSAEVVPSALGLVITIPTPTVTITFITVSLDTMNWLASAEGYAVKQQTTITTSGDLAEIISFPSWITIVNYPNTHGALSIGYEVANGETLSVYPTHPNTGVSRWGDIVLRDAIGNQVVVTVSQDSPMTDPNITVLTGGPPITLYDASGTCTYGSADISVTFTPDNSNYGFLDHFSAPYTIYKESIEVGSGIFTVLRNQTVNIRSLTMSSTAGHGESIIVYIGEII